MTSKDPNPEEELLRKERRQLGLKVSSALSSSCRELIALREEYTFTAIAEMKRVVTPGGTVASYIWDFTGRRNTQGPLLQALEDMGVVVPPVPRIEFTRIDTMRDLFVSTGLDEVTDRTIEIQLEFADFDNYWASQTGLATPAVKPILAMPAAEVEHLKASLRERLPTDAEGRITYMARVNAIKGHVPE